MLKNFQISVLKPKIAAKKQNWGKLSVGLCATQL